MSALETFRDGRFGVRFNVGDDFQVMEQSDVHAQLTRPGDDTAWTLVFSPLRLGLRPEHDDVLRADVERQVRFLFQKQHAALGPGQRPPRTDDPEWSPLIELERVSLEGAPALRVLYRTAYGPGLEIIVGNLLIPVEGGMCQFTVHHGTRLTGLRETIILDRALGQSPGMDPEAVVRQLGGQRAYDAPEEDAAFPEHGLSRVRGALAWLMDRERSGLQVLAPMPLPPTGEVVLEELGCAITPPPRYTRVPSEDLGLEESIAMFTRPVVEEIRLMDVWRSPDDRLPRGPDRTRRLAAIARENARGWEREGASNIEMETRELPEADGVAQVANELRFLAHGHPTRSMARWLADTDGAVFRITVGGLPYLTSEELTEEADRVVRSWRRLPDDSAPPESKPWWRIW